MKRSKMFVKIFLVRELAVIAGISLRKAEITHPVLDGSEILFEVGCQFNHVCEFLRVFLLAA